MNADRFDDLAREIAQRPTVNRRRVLGRMFAVLAGAAAVGTIEADPAGAAKPSPGVTCPPGLSVCNNLCRDLNADAVNCGACGNICSASQTCRGGTCVDIPCTCPLGCPSGQTDCNGTCIDLATSNTNCGSCGHACGTGQTCVNGICTTSCPSGQTLCNGLCVTLSSDPQNCGSCGTACPPSSTCSRSLCSNGTCVSSPAPAGTVCGPPICADATHSTVSTCNGSGSCASVTQSCAPYTCGPSGTCLTACTNNADCAVGNVCSGGLCVPAPPGP